MARIRVAVSPFYGGEDWTDAATGITFKRNEHGLSVYSIPEDIDLSGIRKAIRLNALMLIEGKVPYGTDEVIIHKEPVKEIKAEEIEVEEVKAEEAVKETTKSKATKKASKK